VSTTKIRCNRCGFEARDGEYDTYVGERVENGIVKTVQLRGDHPYRLGGTHVCDRFEYGTFERVP